MRIDALFEFEGVRALFYQAEVATFSSPGLVFTYELTLTMRTGERVESSSLPAGFEWLLIHFQGWSLEVTVDLPWEQRKEAVIVWHVSPLIPILRRPLPVLFVVHQDTCTKALYPFLRVAATVGIPRTPEGSAVTLRELQGPTGEAIPVRIELVVNQRSERRSVSRGLRSSRLVESAPWHR